MTYSPELIALGEARKNARAQKDFAQADQIRDQIADLGWEILDTPEGFDFRAIPKYPTYARITEIKKLNLSDYLLAIGVIVDGFIADASETLQSIKANTSSEKAIVLLINGDFDMAPLVAEIDERTFLVHILAPAGWGECANAILKICEVPIVVLIDPSTRFTGDAISIISQEFQSGDWSAVGWRGGLVDVEDEWRSVADRGEGEVDVLFSYFLAVNREAALDAGGFNARAIYYRNADIEFSLRLRQVKGRLLQIDLPLTQARHHGYYDVDPEFRDLQSRKNYDRILERFRGKNEILAPRR